MVVIEGELEIAGQDSHAGGELKAEYWRINQTNEDLEDNLEKLYYDLLHQDNRKPVPTVVRAAAEDTSFPI